MTDRDFDSSFVPDKSPQGCPTCGRTTITVNGRRVCSNCSTRSQKKQSEYQTTVVDPGHKAMGGIVKDLDKGVKVQKRKRGRPPKLKVTRIERPLTENSPPGPPEAKVEFADKRDEFLHRIARFLDDFPIQNVGEARIVIQIQKEIKGRA